MSNLTAAQQVTLKAYIELNATWMAYTHNADGAFQIADDLQADSSFIVWRSNVSETEFTNDESSEATNWSWTGYIARTVAEKAGYDRMFREGFINPSKPNIRQGFVDVFSGDNSQISHMAAISKRAANLLEELFATGTGSTGSPGTMEIEGSLRYRDILEAMGW